MKILNYGHWKVCCWNKSYPTYLTPAIGMAVDSDDQKLGRVVYVSIEWLVWGIAIEHIQRI